jgi:hypothetical protein
LREALLTAAEEYRIMLLDSVVKVGPNWECPEDPEIEALCERLGYGDVISRAAYLWQRKDQIGAFVQGPCLGTVQSSLKLFRAALAGGDPHA